MGTDVIYCPACGTNNKVGSRFCFKCGSPIRVIGQTSPAASTVNAVPAGKPADRGEETREGAFAHGPKKKPGRQPTGEIVITKGRKHTIIFSKIAGAKIKLGWVIMGIAIFLGVSIIAGIPLLLEVSKPKATATPPPCLCNGETRTPIGTPTETPTKTLTNGVGLPPKKTSTKTVAPTPTPKAFTFEGLWVDEKGGTSANGLYTPPAEVYFHNGKAYFGFHGESMADLVSNVGGTGITGGADFKLTTTTLTISANGTERQYTRDGELRWGLGDTWLIPDKDAGQDSGHLEPVTH